MQNKDRLDKQREEEITMFSESLRRNGAVIKDIKRVKSSHPGRYSEYVGHDLSFDPYACSPMDRQWEPSWEVTLDNKSASRFAGCFENLDRVSRENRRNYDDAKAARLHLQEHENKVVELKRVLHENPDIKRQWDELSILLKLAGLKNPLL